MCLVAERNTNDASLTRRSNTTLRQVTRLYKRPPEFVVSRLERRVPIISTVGQSERTRKSTVNRSIAKMGECLRSKSYVQDNIEWSIHLRLASLCLANLRNHLDGVMYNHNVLRPLPRYNPVESCDARAMTQGEDATSRPDVSDTLA